MTTCTCSTSTTRHYWGCALVGSRPHSERVRFAALVAARRAERERLGARGAV